MNNEAPTDPEAEPVDDAIIAQALKWSVIGLVSVACVAAAVVWYLRRPVPKETIAEATTTLATTRAAQDVVLPQVPFADITGAAGIRFIQENGAAGQKLLPETMVGGGAFFDFDNDLDQDILFVNAMPWDATSQDSDTAPTCALYENDGSGHFTDVTRGSGLDLSLYGMGVACGDYDGDGLVDIFLTAVGPNRLLHNDGGGHFTDVTATAGVAGEPDRWSSSSGFFDCDNDGDLDLMVCNYVAWSRDFDEAQDFTLDGTLRAYGSPQSFRGTSPYLYRNDGDGHFTDITTEAGMQIRDPNTDEPMAKSLGLCFHDVNGDGLLDVMIANDTVQNMLFLNRGEGRFEETAALAGLAFDNNGAARGAMGADSAFFRNSDAIGIAVGNFANEMTALYVSSTPLSDPPQFTDEAVSNGIGPVTRMELTFGVLFLDVDLDGRLDLFAANGHLEEDINKVQESQHYEQPPQLLWNCGPDFADEFVILPAENTGPDFVKPMVGRGASYADIDADGDLDLLVFASGQSPRLLRNDQQTKHHWLRVALSSPSPNTSAIGASVAAELADGTMMRRLVSPTRGYQSQVELPVTFGLGTHSAVERLTIRWPDGQTQSLKNVHADQLLQVRQSTTK